MTDTRIISASAGSGKTYRLAEELRDAIIEDGYRPEAVVATTFTKKAARELQERVRTRLLAEGRSDLAQRLMAARIGTVHSVCQRLLQDFAFDRGISPDLDVLPAVDADEIDPHLERALAEVTTDETADQLSELSERFGPKAKDWKKHVHQILSRLRTNDITLEMLSDAAERSKASLLAQLGPPAKDGTALDRALRKALSDYTVNPEVLASEVGLDDKCRNRAAPALRLLESGRLLPWSTWCTLANLKPSAGRREDTEPVKTAASAHDAHPRFRADVETYIDLVFRLAGLAMERYQRRKAAQGVIDYDDMESFAYALLGDPAVQARLDGQIDLVLVDEFQDTNPIQLAIFLRLAKLAKRSVWVGDQKQSIYRFRGADPILMDAVIEDLEKRKAVDSLPYSWRSRPELVDLISALFTPAFAQQGLPADRVRLGTPPEERYPRDLGAPVEIWRLVNDDGKAVKAAERWPAVAAGVRALLDDPTVKVRDRITGESRPVEPRDIAILPFGKKQPAEIAAALEEQGIPAAVARVTLQSTAEYRVILAALKLWASPADTLAAATLARYLQYPEGQDELLATALRVAAANREAPRTGPPLFDDIPAVREIRTLAEEEPGIGLVDAFDRLVTIARLRTLCRRWSDAERRLANLEAIRSYVLSYASGGDTATPYAQGGMSTVPTPNGLIAYLGSSATDEAPPGTMNAVTAVNWHKAKGLEWPVTIVVLNSRRPKITDVFDVDAVRQNAEAPIDLGAPLDERWIRCWPYPYGGNSSGIPLIERLKKDSDAKLTLEQAKREELRLLYVMLTRARDRLILVPGGKALVKGSVLETLNVPSEEAVVGEVGADDEVLRWGGLETPLKQRVLRPAEPKEVRPTAARDFEVGQTRAYPPAYLQPSRMASEEERAGLEFEAPISLGEPLEVKGRPDWAALGQALHAFLAADRPGLAPEKRIAIAERLLDAWGVATSLEVKDVLAASTRLRDWIQREHPGAAPRHEAPLRYRSPGGSVVRGAADLILEIEDAYIVIDHKAFPREMEEVAGRSDEVAAQLASYRAALELRSPGRRVVLYQHNPVLARIRRA